MKRSPAATQAILFCHCEARSAEAISSPALDCFAALAMLRGSPRPCGARDDKTVALIREARPAGPPGHCDQDHRHQADGDTQRGHPSVQAIDPEVVEQRTHRLRAWGIG